MNYELVNEDCKLGFKSPIIGTIKILSTSLLSKIKTSGKRVYNDIFFSITNATDGSITSGSLPLGTLKGNSEKIKSLMLPVVRKDAEVKVIITGILGSSTGTFNAIVYVVDAGQTNVKGI